MKKKPDIQILWLAIAAAALFFSGGKYNFAPAVWIGGIFLIRFCRNGKAVARLTAALVMIWLVIMISWRGIQPMTGVAYIISMLVAAIISTLPLLADRLLFRRLPGWLGTLVFPAVSTALEFALISTNPMGSFGAVAYSQFGFTALLQFASIGGLSGISFLISWFPALVNYKWERPWKKSKLLLAVSGLLYLGVILFGVIRISSSAEAAKTVEVSMVIRGDGDENLRSVMNRGQSSGSAAERILSGFVEQTLTEAASGAQIVVWPEGAVIVQMADVQEMRDSLGEISAQAEIYLIAPYLLLNEDSFENGLDIYSPEGEILLNHIKFGGNVFEGSLPGDGILRSVDTEFGRIGAVVCWDMDFPDIINQAGRDSFDILFSPSCEWREVVPTHARMAVFRGVENGLSTVHPASLGLSLAADPYGRSLGELNWFETENAVLRVSVSVERTETLYSRIGELFGPVSAALSFLLILNGILIAIISKRRNRN